MDTISTSFICPDSTTGPVFLSAYIFCYPNQTTTYKHVNGLNSPVLLNGQQLSLRTDYIMNKNFFTLHILFKVNPIITQYNLQTNHFISYTLLSFEHLSQYWCSHLVVLPLGQGTTTYYINNNSQRHHHSDYEHSKCWWPAVWKYIWIGGANNGLSYLNWKMTSCLPLARKSFNTSSNVLPSRI